MAAEVVGDIQVNVKANLKQFNSGIKSTVGKMKILRSSFKETERAMGQAAREAAAFTMERVRAGLMKAARAAKIATASFKIAFAAGKKLGRLSLAGLSKTATVAQAGLRGIGRTAKTMALAGTVAFAGMTFLGGRFQKQMQKVKAIMVLGGNESVEQFQALEKEARKLGKTTEKTPFQVAKAIEEFLRAGFSAEDTIKSLGATIDLATASDIELIDAVKVTTGIFGPLRSKVRDVFQVMDVLNATAGRSRTDILALKESFKFLVGALRVTNLSLEEGSSALGVLASAGKLGGMSGRGLAKALTVLSKAASDKKIAKKFQKLGINIKKLAPETNSLADIIDALSGKIKTVGEASTVFGDIAGRVMIDLIGEGSVKLRNFTAALKASDGATKKAANTMRKGVFPAIVELGSALEDVSISMFGKYKKALEDSIRSTTMWVRSIGTQVSKSKTLQIVINKIRVAFGELFKGIRDVARAIGKRLFSAAGDAGNEFLKIVTAIGLKLQAWAKDKDLMNTISTAIIDLGKFAIKVGGMIKNGIVLIVKGLFFLIPKLVSVVLSGIADAAEGINSLATMFSNSGKSIKDRVKVTFSFIKANALDLIKFFTLEFPKLGKFLGTNAQQMASKIRRANAEITSSLAEMNKKGKRVNVIPPESLKRLRTLSKEANKFAQSQFWELENLAGKVALDKPLFLGKQLKQAADILNKTKKDVETTFQGGPTEKPEIKKAADQDVANELLTMGREIGRRMEDKNRMNKLMVQTFSGALKELLPFINDRIEVAAAEDVRNAITKFKSALAQRDAGNTTLAEKKMIGISGVK